jgi:hypothetical protein
VLLLLQATEAGWLWRLILLASSSLVARAEQPTRRAALLGSASRRLLLTEFGVPRFDPRPEEEEGPGFKMRGGSGFRWAPSVNPRLGPSVRLPFFRNDMT